MRVRYRFAATCLGLILGACGTGGEANSGLDANSGSETRVVAEEAVQGTSDASHLRLDGIYRPCGAGLRFPGNPFGLNSGQWESADANRRFLRGTKARAMAMEAATGKPVRIVFHQPGGWYSASGGGMHGAVPTVAIMNGRKRNGNELYPFRWQVWAQELTTMASNYPGWILAVYFSGQVPTANAQDTVDTGQSYETYDHDDPRHRALVLGVVDQWLAVGVREFIFDGSSRVSEHPDLPELAAEIRAKGARVFTEPHPRHEDRTLRSDMYQHIDGSLSTHVSMVTNEPASRNWVIPDSAVMMVALTGHESSSKPSRTPARWADVEEYRRRGFVLLSSSTIFDHFITGSKPVKNNPNYELDLIPLVPGL